MEIAGKVASVFGEMCFSHGFVHLDPHPGNVLVRPLPGSRPSRGGRRPAQLVLLDHGMYREVEDSFRHSYGSLWRALVTGDRESLVVAARELGVGDFADILPLMLTFRPLGSTGTRLGGSIPDAERRRIREQFKDFNFGKVRV